jgi:hypothetical protein
VGRGRPKLAPSEGPGPSAKVQTRVPAPVAAALEREAARRETTVGEVARRALARAAKMIEAKEQKEATPVWTCKPDPTLKPLNPRNPYFYRADGSERTTKEIFGLVAEARAGHRAGMSTEEVRERARGKP